MLFDVAAVLPTETSTIISSLNTKYNNYIVNWNTIVSQNMLFTTITWYVVSNAFSFVLIQGIIYIKIGVTFQLHLTCLLWKCGNVWGLNNQSKLKKTTNWTMQSTLVAITECKILVTTSQEILLWYNKWDDMTFNFAILQLNYFNSSLSGLSVKCFQ